MPSLLEEKPSVRFRFLKQNSNKYDIRLACKILKVSRSGFYRYITAKKSNRTIENEVLEEEIIKIFNEHKGRYGSPRITAELRENGINTNRKRIARIMKKAGVRAKTAPKKYCNYKRSDNCIVSENLINQEFKADHINKIWLGDITYIPAKRSFLYLAIFLDLYTRKVTGWAMDTRMKEALVIDVFNQAIGREKPDKGLIVHR